MERSFSIRQGVEGRNVRLQGGHITNACLLLVYAKGPTPESMQTYELFVLV